MSDIKIGSLWIAEEYTTLARCEVKAVFTGGDGEHRVLLEMLWEDGTTSYNTYREKDFLKEYSPAPARFVVGRTYRLIGGLSDWSYVVVGVRELEGEHYAWAVRKRPNHADAMASLVRPGEYEEI